MWKNGYVPQELLKSLEVEAKVYGKWQKAGKNDNNPRRLIKFSFDKVQATTIRIRIDETYGVENAKLFEVRCYKS